jgi:hypothetical protein
MASERLHYTIEFSMEALSPEANALLVPLVALKDTLGGLQGSVVAHAYVHGLGLDTTLLYVPTWWGERHSAPSCWPNRQTAGRRWRVFPIGGSCWSSSGSFEASRSDLTPKADLPAQAVLPTHHR